MFIFRVEHMRQFCQHDPRYREGGTSATGHGPQRGCQEFFSDSPNFGGYGSPPYIPMMVHERCAATADQWHSWITPDRGCINLYEGDCKDWCQCPESYALHMPREWHIVAYWVEDNAEGIDWRFDSGQIVFNPEFAINMGSVTEDDVYDMHFMNV